PTGASAADQGVRPGVRPGSALGSALQLVRMCSRVRAPRGSRTLPKMLETHCLMSGLSLGIVGLPGNEATIRGSSYPMFRVEKMVGSAPAPMRRGLDDARYGFIVAQGSA